MTKPNKKTTSARSKADRKYRDKQNKKNNNKMDTLLGYRRCMLNMMKVTLLPCIDKHTKHCLDETMNTPTLASILPLKENTKVRISVGSHLELCHKGQRIYHPSLNIDVDIPLGCCLFFYRNLTVHGGGPNESDTNTCTQLFAVYAPEDVSVYYQNSNSSTTIKTCDEGSCKRCGLVNTFKEINDGNLFLKLEDNVIQQNIGHVIYDYNLEEHGFTILKVFDAKKTKNGIINWIEK
mmetsp:Transcript_9243/g.10728  ORF Transcript_9243/g.10728 Transcript_9243/m.10728 type:complete len:236 (+) Transcript_9243:85-792(+)